MLVTQLCIIFELLWRFFLNIKFLFKICSFKWQDVIQDQCSMKFVLGSAAWGNKKRDVFFIAEPQDDFFCFIPISLGAKCKF